MVQTQLMTKTRTAMPVFPTKKYIYHFGPEGADGSAKDKALLGNKGANLAEMSCLNFPVPPGFTLTTDLCGEFLKTGSVSPEVKTSIKQAVKKLEQLTGKTFGGQKNPLLLSVRSGASVSMPGMMDTILNLGLNQNTVEALAKISQDERFAWDTYRRFIQMYSSVVMKMNGSLLEVELKDHKDQKNYSSDCEIPAQDLKQLVPRFKEAILQGTGMLFPEDPWEQLWSAIEAVFKSWNNSRALVYRDLKGYKSTKGTAVNIQTMVFGNRGKDCATGVVFTRNPSTGEKTLFGDFLINAQGEDVVGGIRTPLQILNPETKKDLKTLMPQAFNQLITLCDKLEKHYKFVQDIEFTIEKNKLWLLQTRDAKCNSLAQLKILFDLKDEGYLNEQEILQKVNPHSLTDLLHPSIDNSDKKNVLAKGIPASPGAGIGQIVFDNERAEELSKRGLSVILIRNETSPEDINGMIHSKGILTVRGGMTSHAAVVARSMGKPCVVGCESDSTRIDENRKELLFKNNILKEGDLITLDGSTGQVFLGKVKTKAPLLDKSFFKLMELADRFAKLEVRANAETPVDVKKAKTLGAKGLGLCRTEHMFFAPNRINIMRKMILSENQEERGQHLEELFEMQKTDFYEILKIMSPYPVTIRLLDPPLHEFLPQNQKEILDIANKIGVDEQTLTFKINNLKESNPMLGHRGCRLAITCPEIYLMQVKALSVAMFKLLKEGQKILVEVMIPLVSTPKELDILKTQVKAEIQKAEQNFKINLNISIGTMIELPRACLEADQLARLGDFFSFGTNDLTQTVFGFSRDDSAKFLSIYVQKKILNQDPFTSIDVKGVGELMKIAIQKARQEKKNIKIGLCGEQGGDPKSLLFFHNLGLDYVSCSPYRVPIARLALAQCTLKTQKKGGE